MEKRAQQLLAMRPQVLNATVTSKMSEAEQFQNKTLRPVIKLQNDLFVAVFRNYIHKYKNLFFDLTVDQQLTYIDNAIQKDAKLRNSLKGMIIGQFTVAEYIQYIQDSSALNKRMMNIVKERLQDHIQLLQREPISFPI